MVYAAIVSLAQTIDQILNDDQYSISVLEKQHIISIYEYTTHLKTFLEDFSEKATSTLERRIRNAAYEAEDMIEFLMWKTRWSSSGLTPPPPLCHERYEGVKYADILRLFNDLKIVRELLVGFSGGAEYSWRIPRRSRPNHYLRQTAPSHKDAMIGFDDDLKEIKSRLLGESCQLLVIPIHGIGGIGKTTLARNVYDDPLVKEYFHIRAWVADYDAYGIQVLILEESNTIPQVIVSRVLYERLMGRRYLIVIEDMWSTEVWDHVWNMLPDDNNGSRILLTTRFSDVAAYPDIRSSIHEMRLLNEDQSWNLLRQKAFADQGCPRALKNIGKAIARGCRGFPLAIVVSAGLLSTISKNPALWGEIARYVNSAVTKDGQFGRFLSLNYNHCPHLFRPCSLYMDAFRKDQEVSVFRLTRLWKATIENLMWILNHPHRTQLGVRIHDLENARKKIESTVKQVITINNSFHKEEQQLCDSSIDAPSSSSSKLAPNHNDVMIGFDDYLMEIKYLLCCGPSKLQVIPIFGMGGIGKTTLAKIAFDDQLITENFDIRAWVTISQDYSIQEILSSLLDSMDGFIADISGQNNGEKVYKSLKGRKYLIVLDDMWGIEAWDDLKRLFPDDGIGCRIMLTTRLRNVASYPRLCRSIYEMHFMNEDQSWNLLRHKVFAQQDCPPELENIGKEIAKGCRGLPLAIVVVAGLLSTTSMSPASWAEVAENVNSVVAGEEGQFEKILLLSYTHLPHYLKPCFLYLGAFPEDHEIQVSKLIKLWVAEGFLKCPNGSKSLEEEAEECLENLVKRSLVLVRKRKPSGKIKSFSLHDLMRDLCIRKAKEEDFLAYIRDAYGEYEFSDMCIRKSKEEDFLEYIRDEYGEYEFSNMRRMSIAFPGPLLCYLKTYCSTIRTLIWFLYTTLPCLESFRLLRVLDAGDADVESLPAKLFELFQLRYLATTIPSTGFLQAYHSFRISKP